MVVSAAMGDQTTRFAHLLKPISDLAANWNVDVASDLEEYLEELAGLNLAGAVQQTNLLDGPVADLNFAEAALLIQGSTAVYSKKVEHLYTLVYETLRLVCENREKQVASNGDEEGVEGEPNQQLDFEFLPLDDVIPKGQNINLKEGHTEKSTGAQRGRRKPLVELSIQERAQRAHTLTDVPVALLPRSVFGIREPDGMSNNGVTFRIDYARLHPESGALLLDENDVNMELTEQVSQRPGCPGDDVAPVENADEMAFDQCDLEVHDEVDCNDDDCNSGTPMPMTEDDPVETNLSIESPGPGEPCPLSPAPRNTSIAAPLRPDPWEQLDPHQPTNIKQRPGKVGRPWCRPSRTRTAPEEVSFTNHFAPQLKPVPKTRIGRKLFFDEFEYGLKALRQRRAEEAECALLAARTEMEAAEITVNEEDAEEEAEGVFDFDPGEIGPDDDDAEVEQAWPRLLETAVVPADMDARDQAVGFASLDDTEPREVCGEFNVSRLAASYELACQRYMEESAKMWEKYVLDEDLVKRVATWSEKIEPILEEEGKRDAFDIHVYSDGVVDKFHSTELSSPGIRLSDVTKSTSKFEVCRAFLAALQLAVNGDMLFSDSSGIANPEVELARMQRRNPMEGFLAPSIRAETQSKYKEIGEDGRELARQVLSVIPVNSVARQAKRARRIRSELGDG